MPFDSCLQASLHLPRVILKISGNFSKSQFLTECDTRISDLSRVKFSRVGAPFRQGKCQLQASLGILLQVPNSRFKSLYRRGGGEARNFSKSQRLYREPKPNDRNKARKFSKSQSLHRGEGLKIFWNPRVYTEQEGLELF